VGPTGRLLLVDRSLAQHGCNERENMARNSRLTTYPVGLAAVALGALTFLLVPIRHFHAIVLQGVDFKTVYSSSKCLLDACDPYDSVALLQEYRRGQGDFSRGADLSAFEPHQALYPPSSLFWVVPFALLPWKPALVAWVTVSGILFVTAAFLIADLAQEWGSPVPLVLLGFFVATSTLLLTTAQPSGIAISLCVIGVWSLFRGRAAIAGNVCFALSLALKPQIGGLILVYFLLSGHRRRLRSVVILVMAALFCMPGVIWTAQIPAAVHWPHELGTNLAASASRGSINDPGPTSYNAILVTDLQSIVAVFVDAPKIYNPVSWIVVGVLLLLWSFVALRATHSVRKDLLGVATIACLALLPIYHRHYDVRLLILTFPALGLLFSEGRIPGVLAMLASLAVICGSHPTLIREHLGRHLNTLGPIETVLLLRTSPVILLLTGILYLSYFVQTLRTNRPPVEAMMSPGQSGNG
jgi:Glycosyltransferase family 87